MAFLPKAAAAAAPMAVLISLALLLLLPPQMQRCRALGISSSSSNSTAYEVLESYGFPSGLLPDTVTSYDLDEDDGSFTVSLESSCTVKIPSSSYTIKYSATITGTLEYERLSNLSGVKVKVLFIWWPISSIAVSGSSLVFSVSIASASYDISNFSESPVCSSSASSSSSFFSSS
jgi:hypothetical protein